MAFLEIDPSDLEHIETDKNDLAWIQAIGGEEKAAETQSKYSELARKIRREVAVARWQSSNNNDALLSVKPPSFGRKL
ncbi:MAG: hypothetical protein ACON5D_05515 [Rubripirellula sp.]